MAVIAHIPSDIFKEELERLSEKAVTEVHGNLRPLKSDWIPLPIRYIVQLLESMILYQYVGFSLVGGKSNLPNGLKL